MKSPTGQPRDVGFILTCALAFLIGLGLQTYLLADQVLIDDEWHGLYFVIGKSPVWLLTHFSIPGATCIPQNLYAWALHASLGWSETLLHLPSLVCGLLCLLVGPLLARELVGPRRAALLGLLLAISPMLIFYSRLGRPYSAVALLAFAALLLAGRWIQSGDRRHGLLFIATGVLAVYFHLFAVVTVAAPVLAALVYQAWVRRPGRPSLPVAGPPLRHWLAATAAMAGIGALLILPALLDSLHTTFFSVARVGTLHLRSVPQVALLLSGTGQPLLAMLFWAGVAAGAVEQCRRNPWFGGMLVSLYPLHALALLLARPESAQSAIVLARYCMPLVPVSLLLAACGLQSVLEIVAACAALRPGLQTFTALAGVTAFGLAGPLPQCYVAPNSFTNHGAYQHRYGLINWTQSFFSDFTPPDFPLTTTIRADEVSPFYQQLAEQPNQRPIVEYPMLIGDHFNPLYYYQHFHRRPVLVGYTTDMKLPPGMATGNIYGNTYIDQVLSLVPDSSRLRFRNLVSMDDLAAMRARGAEYVILHKRFEAQLPAIALPPPALERLSRACRKELGAPAYEDAHITAFRL